MSSASQVDNYSLEHQERDLVEYCTRNQVEVSDIYRDPGISGSTIEDRPAIRDLVRDAQAQKFTEVLIARVDRFTRADPWDLYPLVKGLMDLNVKLSSITESFDLADDNGQLIFSILANFASRERKLILLRTGGGKRDRAREGKFTGGKVPFGYVVNPNTHHYMPDDTLWWNDLTKAEVVKLIFEQYLNLQGTRAVMEWLIRNGVPAPYTQWNPATIAQILRNPVYVGTFAWNKRSHSQNKRSRVHKPSEWITLENAHPALIDQEIWDRCLLQRQSMQRGGRPPTEPARLLDGLMVCPDCGSTLTPRQDTKSRTFYYTCASRFNVARLRDGTACMHAPRWEGEELTNLVWDHVTQTILSGRLLELTRDQHGNQNAQLHRIESQVASINKQLKEVERKEAQLLDLTLAGRFSAELLNKKQTAIEKERDVLSAQLREAEASLRKAKASSFTIKDLKALQKELRRVLQDEASLDERRRFLTFWLGGKITVQNNGVVEVVFNRPEPAARERYKLNAPLRQEP